MSGKQAKRTRRDMRGAPPPVRGSGGAGRRQASPRVLAAAGVAVALIVAGIIIAVVLSGGSSKSKTPANVTADLTAVTGIPQHGLVLGNTLARVTLTEWADTSCPICRDFALSTFPTVSSQYLRTGKVKLDLKLVAFVGPSSPRGRELILAAARQDKAWQLYELLYQNQGDETKDWLTDDLVRALGAKIPGLDVDKLLSDATGPAVQSQIEAMNSAASSDGVNATPTFLLTTPDGKRHLLGSGNSPPETFAKAFDQALKG